MLNSWNFRCFSNFRNSQNGPDVVPESLIDCAAAAAVVVATIFSDTPDLNGWNRAFATLQFENFPRMKFSECRFRIRMAGNKVNCFHDAFPAAIKQRCAAEGIRRQIRQRFRPGAVEPAILFRLNESACRPATGDKGVEAFLID